MVLGFVHRAHIIVCQDNGKNLKVIIYALFKKLLEVIVGRKRNNTVLKCFTFIKLLFVTLQSTLDTNLLHKAFMQLSRALKGQPQMGIESISATRFDIIISCGVFPIGVKYSEI